MAVINSPSAGTGAEVNLSNEQLVVTNALRSSVGLQSINDSGAFTGSPTLRSPQTSNDQRLRVGTDTLLYSEVFNATAQNTNNWTYTFNTLTASLPGAGMLQFSTVQGTTNAHGAFMRTFQYFPVFDTAPISCEVTAGLFTATLVANEQQMYGFGIPTAATTEPTDGVWFRLTTSGLVGELRFNGSTTTTSVLRSLAQISVSTMYKYAIMVAEDYVEFWLNQSLLARLQVPVGNGEPFINGSLPVFFMKYNTGAVSNTSLWRVSNVSVLVRDIATNMPIGHQLALQGMAAYQGQNGGTMGSTSGVGTVTSGSTPIPAGSAGSNTAANVTGLGGYGAINATATSATDLIACSYQNPASTINITGRNLVITGVHISTINSGAAVATTPTTLQWSIGYGHTAVSLATTETGSFTSATTKAPRRVFVGFQSVAIGAVAGTPYAPDLFVTFQTPIVVRPGEFINTFLKQVIGTATASQIILYGVQFDGYFI